MKYLAPRSFSVPVGGGKLTGAEWAGIFARKCAGGCGAPVPNKALAGWLMTETIADRKVRFLCPTCAKDPR